MTASGQVLVCGVAALFLACGPADAAWDIGSPVGPGQFSATLDSTNTVPDIAGPPAPATLIVLCQQTLLQAYVRWPTFISTDRQRVSLGFDAAPAIAQDWQTSSLGTATFAPDPRGLLAKMAKASHLSVAVTPPDQGRIVAQFDLQGVAMMAEQALKSCPAP